MGSYQGRRLSPSRRSRRYQGRRLQFSERSQRYQGRRVRPHPLWRRPVLIILTAAMLAFGGLWVREQYRVRREQAAYQTLAQKVHGLEREWLRPASTVLAGEETGEEMVPEVSPYEALAAENPDFTGWLSIPGTVVDYPVMWTPEDPEYYLRRAFDGSDAVSGSLFIGAGCEPEGAHVIVYGHNLKDGSMFGSLSGYKSADYAAAHPVIRFDTLTRSGEYRVLAVFYSHAYLPGEEGFRYYRYTDLSAREDFEAYVREAKAAALYDTGTAAEYGDRLLTLSTCSYHREHGTFVVVAVAPGGGDRSSGSGRHDGSTLT